MDDIVSEFIAETTETLDDLGSNLVAWEKTPDDIQLLNQIFRFFHTIKGSAGFLQLDEIGAIAHIAEDILEKVRQGDARADAATVGQIHTYINEIMALVHALKSNVVSETLHNQTATVRVDNSILEQDLANTGAGHSTTAAAENSDRSRSIRVSVTLIDDLLEKISDFSILSNEYSALLHAFPVNPKLRQTFESLSRTASDVRSTASQMRLQRMDRLFAPLPKAVRDLASACGKLVDIRMAGGAVELDRDMLDRLRDPLTHIVRNAIDHGIESPAVREAAGKPRVGTIQLEAFRRGNDIEIVLSEDGAGLNVNAIFKQAQDRGLIPADSGMPDDATIFTLLTTPGFSTRSSVDTLSGRGVGLDVVRSNIEEIGGQFALHSKPGQGVTIHLRIPLSMSVVSCLILRSGDISYHAPTESIRHIWLVDNPMIAVESVAGTHVVRTPDGNYPMVPLQSILTQHIKNEDQSIEEIALQDKVVIIMKTLNGAEFAMLVDDALEYADAVIRPISPLIATSGPYCGVSLRDSGEATLLLDIMELALFACIDADAIKKTANDGIGNPAIEDIAPDSVAVAMALDGTSVAVPFAMVRRVEQYVREKHIIMDDAHWHQTQTSFLPMIQFSDDISDICHHILILGEDADECALPAMRITQAIAHGKIQHQGNSRKYSGIIQIDDVAVPVLNVDQIRATFVCAKPDLPKPDLQRLPA